MKELFVLFVSFMKIGLFTFGGGYAMLPLIQREIVEKRGWASEEEITDYYAIGQCTPGIIAVNAATFVGYKRKGVSGGIFATLGLVFPSMVVITIIAALLETFASNPYVQNAFAGIRVCVCVLMLNSVVKFWKISIKDRISLVIFAVVFLCAAFLNVSPAVFVILAGAAGLMLGRIKERVK